MTMEVFLHSTKAHLYEPSCTYVYENYFIETRKNVGPLGNYSFLFGNFKSNLSVSFVSENGPRSDGIGQSQVTIASSYIMIRTLQTPTSAHRLRVVF